MLLLILQSAALLLGVFLISGAVGWLLSPKPKRKAHRVSVFDDAPVFAAPEPVRQTESDPMVAAARQMTSAEIIPLRPVATTAPVAAPVGVSTELEPAIMAHIEAPVVATTVVAEPVLETLDRTSRPKASMLSAMTPESVEAAVEQAGTGLEPHRLRGPDGKADDLTLISGIGAPNQKELNDLGIFHYWQVASWTPEHVAWLSARIHSAKRIMRENWMAQAAKMAARAA
ncbi:hypothetical protein PQU92_13670 [Asticcacaulis sp. BYS171W]|uniref:Flap endonuclease-1-like 5' DNA nuclease n=1 Tax=Asticcacaulis aquaticus TaxID=2984212 RepID=A0ABT5HW61_9CAUL|nr:hypothetical protein [Asticcacaulis aquaticus]MDC7684331.1 hypothetical protein [Asticcacaulis aquaticus]